MRVLVAAAPGVIGRCSGAPTAAGDDRRGDQPRRRKHAQMAVIYRRV